MSEKEYIVSLNKGVDYESFNQEMIASTGAGDIPSRSVDVANARPSSLRSTHYSLTDAEAEALRNDPRVYGVNLLPENDPTIGIGFDALQTGNFTKTTLDRGDFLNWGMRRMNEATNPYSGFSVGGGYNYTLDGSGVDVVIMDSGLEINHPEFQGADGLSRVQELDWTTASGIVGMPAQSTNYYRDFDGHGTHVAGTATGKTYGWAKNAQIFSLKLAGLEGPGDSGTGTSTTYAFDCIKEWHNNKPIDPVTGVKRPTVVNMSWGYLRYYSSVSSITYQGVEKTGTDIDTSAKRHAFGMVPIYNPNVGAFVTNVRIPSVDADMEELIDAGVHVMVAAGNRSHKIDVPGGDDYDNLAVTDNGTVNYHRGSSPYSIRAHIVGNIDSTVDAGGLEQKAVSSEAGPGVSVFAPGTDIMSAMSTTNNFGATTLNNPYPANANYLINNITGTSMASPQIAGMLSLWLQLNPDSTPEQGLAFVNSTAKTGQLYDTVSTTDYSTDRSLLGAENRFGFNKFNNNIQLRVGNAPEAIDAPVISTYTLSSNVPNVNEGSSVIFTLTTTNVIDGTTIGYTVTGIDAGDVSESLSGNFTVNSNSATATFNVTADATTEGSELMTLSLAGISESHSVNINDTSITPSAPTYTVTPVATEIDEGSALTLNVTTTDVADATTLYWTVSEPGEFNTSSGSFTITSNTGSFSVTPGNDLLTEGTETFTVSIRSGSISGTVLDETANITINDTSTSPLGISYNVTVASGTNSYGTGNKFYVEGFDGASPEIPLTEGETYLFRQSAGSNATHQLRFSTTPNGTHDGGVEYTNGVEYFGTAGSLGAYTKITVALGAPTLYYYCVNHSGMGGQIDTPAATDPLYTDVTSPTTVNEGESLTFTVTTANVLDGTTVGYTITGIDASDISSGALTGNITINTNTGNTSIVLNNDLTTEGNETAILALASVDSQGTATGGITTSTIITDTSLTPAATYTVTPAANNVDEGSALTFNVATTNVADSTMLYWTVTNEEDFTTSSGSFAITSDAGSFTVTPDSDVTTEGAETFTASVRTVSIEGAIVATSSSVTINDTSTAPVFTPDYEIAVTNSGNSYILTGTDRNGSVSGTQPTLAFNSGDLVRFNVDAGTSSAHPFYIKTTQSSGTINQVSGATGQGTTQLDWTTATDGAGSYGYQCAIHFGMWNTITIT